MVLDTNDSVCSLRRSIQRFPDSRRLIQSKIGLYRKEAPVIKGLPRFSMLTNRSTREGIVGLAA